MRKGTFITLLGVNNIGGTTQSNMLVERMKREGFDTVYVKYPIYDLAPTGPRINAYLRGGNPEELTPVDFQLLNIENKTDYEPLLKEILEGGTQVVAEDYVGTALAWSIGTGMEKSTAVEKNRHLLREDLAILLYGKRFISAVEAGHRHEENASLVDNVGRIHRELAREFGWREVFANEPVEVVHENIWRLVVPVLRQ